MLLGIQREGKPAYITGKGGTPPIAVTPISKNTATVFGYQKMNGVVYRFRIKTMVLVMDVTAEEMEYQERMASYVSGMVQIFRR